MEQHYRNLISFLLVNNREFCLFFWPFLINFQILSCVACPVSLLYLDNVIFMCTWCVSWCLSDIYSLENWHGIDDEAAI